MRGRNRPARLNAVPKFTFRIGTKPRNVTIGGRVRWSGCGNRVRSGLVVKKMARNFWKSESGATAIEYGLLAAMISLAIITTLQALGPELNRIFQIIIDTFA